MKAQETLFCPQSHLKGLVFSGVSWSMEVLW